MNRILSLTAVALVLLAALLLGVRTSGADEITLAHGSSEAEGTAISSPSLSVRKGEPAVAIGMSRLAGQKDEVGYVIVVRGDSDRIKGIEYSTASTMTRGVGSSVGTLKVLEHEAVWRYEMTVDKDKRTETFTLNKDKKDLSKGRIFLIDAEAKEFACTQIDAPLPAGLAITTTTEETDTISTKIVEHLRKTNKTAAEILK